jgi:hypothetical protein
MPTNKLPTDTRMAERSKRRHGAAHRAEDPASLADLSANVAKPTEEELEKLRGDLQVEGEVRDRRIERFVREGPLKPIPRAVVPVSENDL